MEIEKQFVNRLNAIDCPACGMEALSTDPYPAQPGQEVTVECAHCRGTGLILFPQQWQYVDVNAWPLEQTLNKRWPRASTPAGHGNGKLEW